MSELTSLLEPLNIINLIIWHCDDHYCNKKNAGRKFSWQVELWIFSLEIPVIQYNERNGQVTLLSCLKYFPDKNDCSIWSTISAIFQCSQNSPWKIKSYSLNKNSLLLSNPVSETFRICWSWWFMVAQHIIILSSVTTFSMELRNWQMHMNMISPPYGAYGAI